MQNLKLQPQFQNTLIDLKSALVPQTEQKKISLVPRKEVKHDSENFTPQFIDCDTATNRTTKILAMDEHCERHTLKELTALYKKVSFKKFSSVGKVIRRKFVKRVPKITHGYESNIAINRFAFNTPSPDDKILAHLNKNKN